MLRRQRRRDIVQHHPVERAGMQVARLLDENQLVDDRPRRRDPADAQPRRDRLREGAAIEHAAGVDAAGARRVERQQRGQRGAVIAQLVIGRVLDERQAERGGAGDQILPLGKRQALAGRVLEIGDRIGEFGAWRAGIAGGRIGFGRAVVAGRRELAVDGLMGAEGLQRPEIGRPRHQHHVAGREEQAADEVERLLRARGDEDVVDGAGDAARRHRLHEEPAQRRIALARRVLQRDRRTSRIAEDALGGRSDGGAREESGIGDAAGEGHDAGIVEQLEQLADRRTLRLPQARRELRAPIDGHCRLARYFSQYY